jgi:competence ComEA-like helix-hairpin-helix protein
MKRNRAKEKDSFHSVDKVLRKSAPGDIPVFLVVAIFILAVPFISGRQQFLQKNIQPAPPAPTEKYVWLTGSPGMHEGLYFFTPEELENNFPGLDSLPAKAGAPEVNPAVYAIRYTAGKPQKISLPPAVANIFFLPISINHANKNILISLPGIGPVLAEKIVQRRNQHGPFKSKDELLQIAGIGPKKYGALVDRITLD